jgi:hypothetical protein
VRDLPRLLAAVPPGAHAVAACDRRSMASLSEHCMPTGVTRRLPLGRRHAAAAHTRASAPLLPLAGAPPHIANRLGAHAVAPVGTTLKRSCLRRSWPIYPPPGLFLVRAREHTARHRCHLHRPGEPALPLALRPDRASGPLPKPPPEPP